MHAFAGHRWGTIVGLKSEVIQLDIWFKEGRDVFFCQSSASLVVYFSRLDKSLFWIALTSTFRTATVSWPRCATSTVVSATTPYVRATLGLLHKQFSSWRNQQAIQGVRSDSRDLCRSLFSKTFLVQQALHNRILLSATDSVVGNDFCSFKLSATASVAKRQSTGLVIQTTRVRLPAGRPWSCIFRNWSRFGSYIVYLNDTQISYTQLWFSSNKATTWLKLLLFSLWPRSARHCRANILVTARRISITSVLSSLSSSMNCYIFDWSRSLSMWVFSSMQLM